METGANVLEMYMHPFTMLFGFFGRSASLAVAEAIPPIPPLLPQL